MIRKSGAKRFELPGGTRGVLYPSAPDGSHTLAVIETDGRYPDRGRSINAVCTETLLVLDGAFRVLMGDEITELAPGDMLSIPPNTAYAIGGKGKCLDVMTPAWSSKQNRIIK